ncbi:thiol reductant ABC exporter subunit CydC [Pseudogracilibacillus sp. ICA-222130]|uniref:thiol reductant ABC exporter subunit CydC n=1 Tax=Pseudogracilibacillus sp. ICA-222130 TaxID=3134655 RepID=UPI0030BE89FC
MHDWVMTYIKQFKGKMSLAVLFGFLGIASGAMLLFVSGYLISKSSLRPENIMLVYVPIVSVRAFSIGQAVFPYLEKLVGHDVVLSILAKYRKRLYDALEKDAISLRGKYETGDLFQVLSEDIERLQDFYLKTLFPSIIGLLIYTIIIIVIGAFDLVFMLYFLLLLGIIVFLIPFIAYMKMKRTYSEERMERNKYYRHVTDAIFGQLDWLISGRYSELEKNMMQHHETLLQYEQKTNRWHHVRDAVLRFFGGISIVVMLIWTNKIVGEEVISATVLAAFVLMTFSVIDALLPLSDAMEEVPIYKETIDRLQTFVPVEQENEDVSNVFTTLDGPLGIELRHIMYRYDGEKENTINNISVQISPGEKVALLGKSGAGKSTLLKMLAGLVKPTKGEILVGNETIDASFLSRHIAVLNQKPHIFHTTVANNIRIGREDVTDEEIEAVLDKVHLMDYIRTLPKGIHTNVDELGKRFSGGQRQRIAFARVLVQDTPIILLDEPTVGLDPKTERDLIQTFVEAASDKTMVLVTHHLIGAKWMDRVIFLEDGQINIAGHHDQLLKENDYYRALYTLEDQI